MAGVETVRGTIETSALGRTYMHEHIFLLSADVQQNYPGEWGDEQARIDDAVMRLKELAAQGVRTIVDPTVIGLGRYIPRIVRVAEQVPELNIIVATGCYTYDDVPFFFHHRGPSIGRPDPMVDMFVADITEGITGTGVKAGLLKCAIDQQGLTPGVERVMRAVAGAHRATGTPITVHTHPDSESGLVAKRVLCDEEGVDPGRIVLGHSGDSTDVDHLSELAEAGFLLGMDRFGLETTLPTADRIATVVELVRRGFAERLVLSHDAACYMDWVDPALSAAALPNWNFRHIHDTVLPALAEQGVTPEQITTMMVDNPRRFLAGGAA